MPNIFEVIDPRGYTIVCDEETWKWHILSNRPFMQSWQTDVEKAIEQPTFGIFQDANRRERHIYYLRSDGKPRYLKVVVEFKEEQFGRVVTAFPADSMKTGEKLIWTRSND